ncbi:MAG TPA: FAD-dependent oxidoreductase, partial [Flavobacteriales bacterium]|nr:FAD-dependent oxidoreductase [Flavobacteriales bacterium]
TYSTTAEETELLERIVSATQDAGIPMDWVEQGPVPEAFQRVARVPHQAQFHPLRYLAGLAREFKRKGGVLVEQCRVTGLNEGAVVEVHTTKGTVRARHLVYATHIPPGVNVLHFRCAPWRSYAVAVRLQQGNYPDALVYDMRDPYNYYRTQVVDGVPYLIAGGQDHLTGKEADTHARFDRLEAHVRERYGALEVVHRWSSQYFEPADGLPYIGLLPGGGGNVFVATGFGGNGMMLGTLSAIALTGHIVKGASDHTALFDPRRVSPIAGFAQVAAQAADVVGHLISTPFLPEHLAAASELAAGEGRLVRLEGTAMGLFRDEQLRLHAVRPACSHVKCTVAWNGAERSWDCPCHGSRFDVDGALLTGPARKDLERPADAPSA